MLRSTVRVGSASGVVVYKDAKHTVILTAWHVVKEFVGPPRFNGKDVTFPNMKPIPVRLMMMDNLGNAVLVRSYFGKIDTNSLKHDMALVIVNKRLPSTVALVGRHLPKFGDSVWVVGHPYMMYFYTLVKGIVSHPKQRVIRRIGLLAWKVNIYMQISTGVVGGNSGGPVFDHKGRLIGIVIAAVRGAPYLGFATTLPQIRTLIAHSSVMKPKRKKQVKHNVKKES